MARIMLEGYKCERCEHTWVPRSTTESEPTICPKCKSPYWNRPRRTNKIAGQKIAKPRIKGESKQ